MQVTFGAWHVFGKYLLRFVEPLVVADFRVIGAMPLFLGAALARGRRLPAPRDLGRIALLGLLGVTANQLLFILGLQRTTATNAGILQPSTPVFTVAIAAILGIERIGRMKLAGVAIAVAGALVMLDVTQLDLGSARLFGNLLMVGNCLCYSLFLVLQRPLLMRMRALTMIALAYLFGGLAVLLIAGPALAHADLGRMPALAWWAVAFAILVPTTLNYALNTWAIKRSSTTLVATYITLQPVTAAILAAIFLDERPGMREVAGFALIVLGLFAVSRSPTSAPLIAE